MADDKSNRGPADRARINIHEAYEVEYWSKELGVDPERLRELVGKHGVMAADIRKDPG
ncbi:MAG: DUF3606 domain-containing protein [Acidobacteriales bacterium 59-55]|nr:DUF3606 domain-containing protein [Terriglobales bacterium]OJV43317.1 MAG: DUF3606 domain-containing protein [Acidobacteriales bacterium 59-55]